MEFKIRGTPNVYRNDIFESRMIKDIRSLFGCPAYIKMSKGRSRHLLEWFQGWLMGPPRGSHLFPGEERHAAGVGF